MNKHSEELKQEDETAQAMPAITGPWGSFKAA